MRKIKHFVAPVRSCLIMPTCACLGAIMATLNLLAVSVPYIVIVLKCVSKCSKLCGMRGPECWSIIPRMRYCIYGVNWSMEDIKAPPNVGCSMLLRKTGHYASDLLKSLHCLNTNKNSAVTCLLRVLLYRSNNLETNLTRRLFWDGYVVTTAAITIKDVIAAVIIMRKNMCGFRIITVR